MATFSDKLHQYHKQTSDPVNALVFVLPVLLIYDVGMFLGDWEHMNGADFLTGFLYGQLGPSLYLALHVGLFLGIGILAAIRISKGSFVPKLFLPLVLESAVYALVFGSLIIFVLRHSGLLGPTGALGILDVVIVSAGAGLYEELVFRLLILGGLLLFMRKVIELERTPAVILAVLVSAVLFSLAHYMGPETFQWYSFIFRLVAGILFALIFALRGFAVAVYVHFLYDVYVLIGGA